MYLQQGMMNTQAMLDRLHAAAQNNANSIAGAGQQAIRDGMQAKNAVQQGSAHAMQMAQQAQAEEDARRQRMASTLMNLGMGAVTGGLGGSSAGAAPNVLDGVGRDSVQQIAGNELLGGLGNFSQGIQNSPYGKYSNLAAPGMYNWF